MKAKLTLYIAMAAIGFGFSSCKRFYDCKCTNYKGEVTTTVIKSGNRVSAAKSCKALDTPGSCELQ